MQLRVIRGAVVALEGTRLPQAQGTFRSPQVAVLQEYRPGCKQVVAEQAAAEQAAAEAPLQQIVALPSCNATVAATSETTAPQRLLHQELMCRQPL